MGCGKTSHSRVYPAAVAVECVGYIDDRLLSTDALLDKNLFGKEKIFLGGSGFAFRENALGIQSFSMDTNFLIASTQNASSINGMQSRSLETFKRAIFFSGRNNNTLPSALL